MPLILVSLEVVTTESVLNVFTCVCVCVCVCVCEEGGGGGMECEGRKVQKNRDRAGKTSSE